jgi:FAD/FMN-containing dehydrogenase
MPGGNIGSGIIVDLQRFNRPLFVSASRTANVGAAISYAELNRAAQHFSLRLPPDPSSGHSCTLGGMAATNAAGVRSVRFGSIRSWVRGLELMTADGEHGWLGRTGALRSARRPTRAQRPELTHRLAAVRRFHGQAAPAISAHEDVIRERFPATSKNACGYSLDKYLMTRDPVDLVVGSEGTLGFITRVEVDLDLIPQATTTVLLALETLDDLTSTVQLVRGLDPSAVEFLDRSFLELTRFTAIPLDRVEAVLIVEFEREDLKIAQAVAADAVAGTKPWCLYAKTAITEADRKTLWDVRRAASPILASLPPTRRSMQIVEDGCVPIDKLDRYLKGVRQAAARAGIEIVAFGHAGDGHLHVNALVDTTVPGFEGRMEELLSAVTSLVLELGGTPSGEHGDGRLRGPLLEQVYGRTVTDLFRTVKQAFDPSGILNPGIITAAASTPSLRDLKVGNRATPIPPRIAEKLFELERTGAWGVSKWKLAEEGSQGHQPKR